MGEIRLRATTPMYRRQAAESTRGHVACGGREGRKWSRYHLTSTYLTRHVLALIVFPSHPHRAGHEADRSTTTGQLDYPSLSLWLCALFSISWFSDPPDEGLMSHNAGLPGDMLESLRNPFVYMKGVMHEFTHTMLQIDQA